VLYQPGGTLSKTDNGANRMKLSLSRISAAMILALLATAGTGCTLVNKIRAKNELNETARSYKDGHFEEAEQHAKRALELDPNNKTAPIFIARVIHQQYKPGIDAPENIAKAHEAIDAYKRVLEKEPDNEEAYKAVSVLYAAIKDDDKLREWISARATNSNLTSDKRAEAYAILAGKDWDCSYKITELPDVKVISQGDKPGVTYKKPKDPKDFDKASKCVVRGLEAVNNGLKYDPNNESAWTYEGSLFTEQAKLAEMDGKPDQKAAAEKKATEANKRAGALAEERKKREDTASPPGGNP
jgi:tetratricopeptide (TPR) repeat protein